VRDPAEGSDSKKPRKQANREAEAAETQAAREERREAAAAAREERREADKKLSKMDATGLMVILKAERELRAKEVELRESERVGWVHKVKDLVTSLSRFRTVIENRSMLERALLLGVYRSQANPQGFAAQWRDFLNSYLAKLSGPSSTHVHYDKFWKTLKALGVDKRGQSAVESNTAGLAGNLSAIIHSASATSVGGAGFSIGGCDLWKELAAVASTLMEMPAVMDDQIIPSEIKVMNEGCAHVLTLRAMRSQSIHPGRALSRPSSLCIPPPAHSARRRAKMQRHEWILSLT
jgi:ribosomal protein L30/L7E